VESGFIRKQVTRSNALHAETEIVDQRTVLIVSDDREVSRRLKGRWQSEPTAPAFTALRTDLTPGFHPDTFDLAVVGSLCPDVLVRVLRALDPATKPVIVLSQPGEPALAEFPRLLRLTDHPGWPDTVILLASEVLRGQDALRRADRAEQINALLKCHATLGQYVIDMRHSMNNALTSVLGNSELLLLEPGMFSAGVRSQIDTIRNMALRLHEILQRFSSLEKELTFAEKQAAQEHARDIRAAAAGQ
jgi:signal transduction histidine kinase